MQHLLGKDYVIAPYWGKGFRGGLTFPIFEFWNMSGDRLLSVAH